MTDAIQGTLGEVVASAVATTDGEFTFLCGETSALQAVLNALEEEEAAITSVRVLAIDAAIREVTRDHVAATRFADLIASEAVTVRVLDDDRATQTILVGAEVVVAVIADLPEVAVGVPTHDDVVAACRQGVETLWADADEYEPESLPYSELVESIRAEFGDETADDFERAVQTPGVRGLDDTLDLVDLLVLLAARHRHQFYELTQWGSDAGVASVGTFSQAKRRLEEIGLVGTETVHSGDVGRPRQRLVLANEDLQDVSVEELVAMAQRVLVD